jgi:hypothetical protein
VARNLLFLSVGKIQVLESDEKNVSVSVSVIVFTEVVFDLIREREKESQVTPVKVQRDFSLGPDFYNNYWFRFSSPIKAIYLLMH